MNVNRPKSTGRPTACTPKVIKDICKHLEKGSPIEDAVLLAGICEKTYYDWKTRGEKGEEPFATFLQESKKARSKARQYMLDILWKCSKDPKSYNSKPAQWFLSKSDRKNFGSEIKIETEHKITPDDLAKELEVNPDLAKELEVSD